MISWHRTVLLSHEPTWKPDWRNKSIFQPWEFSFFCVCVKFKYTGGQWDSKYYLSIFKDISIYKSQKTTICSYYKNNKSSKLGLFLAAQNII